MSAEYSDDHLLWNSLKQDDHGALADLYQRYYQTLYSYGYKVCPEADAVKDAIQDLFVSLWHSREKLSPVDSVKFYLFRSLRRKLHRSSEEQSRWSTDLPDFSSLDNTLTPEQLLLEQEHKDALTEKLTQILQLLPPRQLEVITLRYYENFKNPEIASIMGISEKTVRNMLHKGLSQLRDQAQFLMPFLEIVLLWLLA